MAQDKLLARYNCGPVKFTGGENALYERHLTFDQGIPVGAARPPRSIVRPVRCSARRQLNSWPLVTSGRSSPTSVPQVGAIPLSTAGDKLKTVKPNGNLVRTTRALGISLGD